MPWLCRVGRADRTRRKATHETRYSSRLSSCDGALRLRPHVPDSLDHQGRHAARGNLLELSPLLHWQAEAGGYRGPRRALHQEIRRRRVQSRRRQEVAGAIETRNPKLEIRLTGLASCAEFRVSLFESRFSNSTGVKSTPNVATQSRMFDSSHPGEHVDSAPPRVTLRNAFAHPFDSAIAAARTCYAPRLIAPEEITDKQRLNIGAATFFSGHHTVYQHAHFEFGLENISRQFVWSFLHAHPFYNSEQQSQRYVRLDRAQAYVPPTATADNPKFGAAEREIYERAITRAWNYYRELTQLLEPAAREILSDIWHVSAMSHPKRVQKVDRQSEKRAIEIARYVLPVAAFTTMVHTLSGIVLHRLWRMSAA